MKHSVDTDDGEEQESSDGGPDESYIKDAAGAVGDLTPADFSAMSGAKVPTHAEDGEMVTVLLTGKAKNGFLADVSGAECAMGSSGGEKEGRSKGRIKIMIMGGENGEGGYK